VSPNAKHVPCLEAHDLRGSCLAQGPKRSFGDARFPSGSLGTRAKSKGKSQKPKVRNGSGPRPLGAWYRVSSPERLRSDSGCPASGGALECGGSTPLSLRAERAGGLRTGTRPWSLGWSVRRGPLRGEAKAASSRRTPHKTPCRVAPRATRERCLLRRRSSDSGATPERFCALSGGGTLLSLPSSGLVRVWRVRLAAGLAGVRCFRISGEEVLK